MIIAAKIVVRKSFVGVDVAECQSATVLDVVCDGGRHHFVVSYADPTENGTVRPNRAGFYAAANFRYRHRSRSAADHSARPSDARSASVREGFAGGSRSALSNVRSANVPGPR